MDIHAIYRFFQSRFRPIRIKKLRDRFPLIDDPKASILDVGGTAAWWADVKPATRAITIVNLDGTWEMETKRAGFQFAVADGRQLGFQSGQFDLAHSNSVIEHVGGLDDQRRFASEMLRCGKSIYLQTPNKWFFVEPHLITVFIHWLPFSVLRKLVRWFTVWGIVHKPTQAQTDEFLQGIRLVSKEEIVSMFPGCSLWEEKVLGMTKSFVLTRGSGTTTGR